MKASILRIFLFVCAFVPAALWAQDTAQITGAVTDPSGAAVANAQVVVTDVARGTTRTATTNSSGGYLFSAMPIGKYDMAVTATGFKKYQAQGIVLDVGQKARNDVILAVGTTQETVNVEGTNVAQVETQSSELAGTVTGKEIAQLQLNGRNFTQLVTLAPGVNSQTGQDEGTVGVYGNVSYSVNGGRVEYNNWELDGGDNMDNGSNDTLNVYPSIDAIAEFKVLTSNYGAQYGRNGSGTVEVETKAGQNRFHGDAYEFWRNDVLNAKNMFDQVQKPDGNFVAPPYKKNDFGYTVGGPIWKDHTFFFWSQEWRRERVPTSFNNPVPSLAERSGNFSDLCPNPTNGDNTDCPVEPAGMPNAGKPFPGNQVPFSSNDPNVQALLGYIPLPTTGTPGAEFYSASITTPTTWREELIRLDHNVTSNERLTFRFIHDSWTTVVPTPLWTNGTSFPTVQNNFNGPGVSLVARLTSTIKPTLLNEFVFSYTTDHIILHSVGNWQRGPNVTIGGIFQNGFNGTLPGINLVGGNAYGGGFAEDPGYIPNGTYNSNPTYTLRDNVTKIIGQHNLQFGAYAALAEKNELGGELGAGSVPGLLTFDSSNSAVSTGNPVADLLMGNISSFGQQNQFRKYYNRYKVFEPYFQDDWRVTNRLTLNLGLRVSLFGTYREIKQQAFNFDPAAYNPATAPAIDTLQGTPGNITGASGALVPAGMGNSPANANPFDGLVQCGGKGGSFPINGFPGASVVGSPYPGCQQGHLFNPAPRIGLAYDPRGNGKMAIRAGYGMFYEHSNGNEANSESLENSPPLAFAVTQNNIFGYPNIGAGLAGSAPVFPITVTSIPNKITWPYVQQWHLDVQRELPGHVVATVSYVGSKGTHLSRVLDINQLRPVAPGQNPYTPGETFGTGGTARDCNGADAYGVPQSGFTPLGAAIPYAGFGVLSPAVNVGVANCGALADPFRTYRGYADVSQLAYAASSIYHALQFSAVRNVGQLQLSLAYTYSHSIDDASDRSDTSFVNSFDPASNRASSNFDERHVLSLGYDWNMQFFKHPSLASKILGGWEYSGITTFNTGAPFSVTYSTVSDNAGVANGIGSGSRPDVVGDPNAPFTQTPLSSHGPQWYDPAAFGAPTALTFGTAPRNFLRNPSRLNFDMALFKHFPIRESMGFEFRVEAFNVFNQNEWGNLGGNSGSAGGSATTSFPASDFLFVNSAHNPRILQLALKFLF